MDAQPSPKILDALWRYRWSSLGIVALVLLVSVGVAFLLGDRSTAQARIVLKTPDKVGLVGVEPGSESAFVRYVNQRALFVVSDRVLSAAAESRGNAESVQTLREQVTAEASANGESIIVRVDTGDYADSAAIADAVAGAYQRESLADVQAAARKMLDTLAARREAIVASLPDGTATERSSDPNTSAAGQSLSELDKQVTEVRVAAEQFGDGVSFVDKAVADPDGGSLPRDAAIGLVFGLLLAATVAWVRADRDRRVRDADDLAGVVEEPVLAEVETLTGAELAALSEVGSPPLWPYQFAASGLRTTVDRGVVVVTGAGQGDGSTTAILQMATAAARSGSRVLVVDAAVRSHGLSDLLGLRYERFGLTAIAVGASRLDDCTRVIDLGDHVCLWVVAAGQYEETTLDHFRATLLRTAVSGMRGGYDLVLIDAPSPGIAPEVTPLVRESDGVVVVVARDRHTRALRKLRDQITLLGGTINGYLFTFARPRTDTPRRKVFGGPGRRYP
ncbi:cellulose synthase operon protein YhjQ/BcsQ [Amycolatopsis aidingensis]|uniref:cellulose synthase operon protein YhjQ/BcsQ n=1 Tax=Amycolatopsis aidingensis TaxID=2842453 RepID=UPI001C0E2D59|nr:cellulose synthase operon protein YhjQ/BcsQ [Amycolatopsis aidingensis]